MAGIQSESALPGDLKFNQINNNYYTPSFKRICAEFEIPSGTDFTASKEVIITVLDLFSFL